MARCIAKICGDGNLSKTNVRYTNTCSVLLEQFKTDMTKEFGKVHFTIGSVKSGTQFVNISSKAIAASFKGFLSSYKSRDISIPSEITENVDLLREFLISYFDDEGCASLRLDKKTNEWKRNVTVASNSIKMIMQIKSTLESVFGIYANTIIKDSKGDKIWYVISITGKSNFIVFKEELGFTHPRKAKRLELILKSYNATYKRNKLAFIGLYNELNKLRKVPIPPRS